MSGFEYAAAAEMVFEGLLKEGFTVRKGFLHPLRRPTPYGRDSGRQERVGIHRQPVCDDECGILRPSHERLVHASGMPGVHLRRTGRCHRLQTRLSTRRPSVLFTRPRGTVCLTSRRAEKAQSNRIEVRAGSLKLRTLLLALPRKAANRITLRVGERELAFSVKQADGLMPFAVGCARRARAGDMLARNVTGRTVGHSWQTSSAARAGGRSRRRAVSRPHAPAPTCAAFARVLCGVGCPACRSIHARTRSISTTTTPLSVPWAKAEPHSEPVLRAHPFAD